MTGWLAALGGTKNVLCWGILLISTALIACGSEDPRATPEESRRIAALFADGRYEEFTGARHVPNVEQPEAFNRVLLDWLAQNR